MARSDTHKKVVGKERQLKIHGTAILPAMFDFVQWQETLDLSLFAMLGNAFLVLWQREYRKPVCPVRTCAQKVVFASRNYDFGNLLHLCHFLTSLWFVATGVIRTDCR
jgi:hypothetical protein